MQTKLKPEIQNSAAGKTANSILRKCVHCGFCLATCPTYQILGDERDSPRGRIYLIKSLLEGDVDSSVVQTHLDRCLTCRGCETTCPSGVEYAELLDVGRTQLAEQNTLGFFNSFYRWCLRRFLTNRSLFKSCVSIARLFKPLLPRGLTKQLNNARYQPTATQVSACSRKVILFRGCVQPTLTPDTNLIVKDLLTEIGIEAIEVEQEQCCGALSHHLAAQNEAKDFIRNNIDSWWPMIDDVEAIISTASGCGVMLKDYAKLLSDDPAYSEKAEKISAMAQDVSEYFKSNFTASDDQKSQRLAFHNPCTLQHGQKIQGLVESILESCGFTLLKFQDAHMCCGSAGSYSILQPELSKQLQKKKINNIEAVKPDVIVTANIGCQLHLQQATDIPVRHWVELLK